MNGPLPILFYSVIFRDLDSAWLYTYIIKFLIEFESCLYNKTFFDVKGSARRVKWRQR